MKPGWFLLLFSLVLFVQSCKLFKRHKQPEDVIEYAEFCEGGGFTGQTICLRLENDGSVYRAGMDSSRVLIKKISAKSADSILKETAVFFGTVVNGEKLTGNLTRSIAHARGTVEHEISWAAEDIKKIRNDSFYLKMMEKLR